jgi:hypothetical protein
MDATRVLHSRGLGTAFTGDRVSSQMVILSLASTIHKIHVVESIKKSKGYAFGTGLFPEEAKDSFSRSSFLVRCKAATAVRSCWLLFGKRCQKCRYFLVEWVPVS